ncbi:HD domain-containing protein [Bacillus spongiae]|uniref:HD domain-containing protein n=1 Tax=Bacillus spongiae TaxID=2683610 RepID=A0ABU8HDQ8_9BACI
MSKEDVEQFVRELLKNDFSGHDWYHIDRVRTLALKIVNEEQIGNPDIVEYAALLHDVADKKLVNEATGAKWLEQALTKVPLLDEDKKHIKEIVMNISYNGGNEKKLHSIEGEIVRDADRLDAIGAIGIARVFAYGGSKGQAIFDPKVKVREEMSEEEYRNDKTSSVHHFYEKLFKLKDLMTTKTGKRIAEERTLFMQQYIHRFYEEWKGTK